MSEKPDTLVGRIQAMLAAAGAKPAAAGETLVDRIQAYVAAPGTARPGPDAPLTKVEVVEP